MDCSQQANDMCLLLRPAFSSLLSLEILRVSLSEAALRGSLSALSRLNSAHSSLHHCSFVHFDQHLSEITYDICFHFVQAYQ
jgi:hypothetical protein